MSIIKFLTKHAALPAVLLSNCLSAEQPLGLVGARVLPTGAAYAAIISSSGTVIPLSTPIAPSDINAVAINDSGQGIIGGDAGSPAYAARLLPSGGMTFVLPLMLNVPNGIINSVAINASSSGIIGGTNLLAAYAALISPSGDVTPLTLGIPNGTINSVAINASNQAIIGGSNTVFLGYAARISPSGDVAPLTLDIPSMNISSVAINASNQALIGGGVADVGAIVGIVAPSGLVTSLVLGTSGSIVSVAINDAPLGIIGGNISGSAYAAHILPSGDVKPIALDSTAGDIIQAVAINEFGQGIIGGGNELPGSPPIYAAFISPAGNVTPIQISVTKGFIRSVAINAFGQGLIAGNSQSTSYVAIVSPSGIATRITALNILSSPVVAILPLMTNIPTGALSGNNLSFAKYINENVPLDAFYFVPSFFDDTLSAALESAAPTRNALSLYTAMSNVFYLNHALSNHFRNAEHFQNRAALNKTVACISPDELTASMANERAVKSDTQANRPYTLWFDGIGALSYQQAQKQTVGFNPTTGAAIVGFDAALNAHSWIGVGAAYGYTQIHEKKDAGHGHINQEYLFVYGSYQKAQFYIDGALWGGLVQITQVRKIHMTGFEFKSTSHPHGGQLAPHLELGGNAYHDPFLTINPFAMLDWVAAWQEGYKERGSGPFNAGQKHHFSSMLRTELGSRFYETLSFDAWRLTFQEKLSYVYKKPFHVGKMNAFLVGAPGTFVVETFTTPQNLGVVEFGMIFEPIDRRYPYGTVTYQGEFGSSSQSHQVSLELAWNF